MTELEAKAKDFIENHTHKLVDKPTKQDIYLREESIYISGYKQGLHEGQPKWHDLRKNPNDLPKVTKEYITNIGVMTFDRLKDRHLWTTSLCDACDYCEEVTDEVIAWCEIPQFKE